MFRELPKKSDAAIVAEWNALAPVRFDQITSGEDITFRHVLAPEIIRLVSLQGVSTILDAGCGVGVLSHMLAERGHRVTGIDPSERSIAIATSHFSDSVLFRALSIEAYADSRPSPADLIIANMVLMDVVNLASFLSAARSLLRSGGALIFSITHPCFWPAYYGYADEPWFCYKREIIIESPFRISAQQDCTLTSTHVHRPVEKYLQEFASSGMQLETLLEPIPDAGVQKMYSTAWKSPRYMVGLCRA
jgi:SAM-dependent methyltransferase